MQDKLQSSGPLDCYADFTMQHKLNAESIVGAHEFSLSTFNYLPILDPVQDTSEMGTVTERVPPRGVCVTTLKLFP